MQDLPFGVPRPQPAWVTNLVLEAGQTAPSDPPLCPTCLGLGLPHSVNRTISTVEAKRMPTPRLPVFDDSGIAHIHDARQENHAMNCSNGHRWVDRYISRCPACGWVVDDDIGT